ncbi:hypothetical protein Q0S19_12285 [Stenotrophomonas indicatrix]|uniref:hypothetical protein n=1 Tax=Stenotrophomonas indicatrix TaxID=2045451 RepID=UPI001AA19DB8|nr:hypothetical protein [Stenotrophomonas indicatrix]MBO1748282.1 hypothetical protein [Stenotrophomonas indicatrix]MDN8645242.1 hypothetical protein [Stenotrophomonas indicatrix]MDN8656179.1 hypothetical protein [Stenotrophomonas indicatrix]
MTSWNLSAVRAYAPAVVGWSLALSGWLRLEQLRNDQQARMLVPVVQWGVALMLLVTLGCIVVTSLVLWRAGRRDARQRP